MSGSNSVRSEESTHYTTVVWRYSDGWKAQVIASEDCILLKERYPDVVFGNQHPGGTPESELSS